MAGKTTPAFYKDFNKPADCECDVCVLGPHMRQSTPPCDAGA